MHTNAPVTPEIIPFPVARRERRRLDWEAIERDYATGQLTQRELAAKHGTSEAFLSRRIARDRKADPTRWGKDLTAAVRQATMAKVIRSMSRPAGEAAAASTSASSECKVKPEEAKSTRPDLTLENTQTADAVDAAASTAADVILGQQARAGRAIGVTMRLLEELDATTMKAGELEQLMNKVAEDLTGPEREAFRSRVHDFMRLHSRIASMQKLMDTLGKAQAQESAAYNLVDTKALGGDTFEARVDAINLAQLS